MSQTRHETHKATHNGPKVNTSAVLKYNRIVINSSNVNNLIHFYFANKLFPIRNIKRDPIPHLIILCKREPSPCLISPVVFRNRSWGPVPSELLSVLTWVLKRYRKHLKMNYILIIHYRKDLRNIIIISDNNAFYDN